MGDNWGRYPGKFLRLRRCTCVRVSQDWYVSPYESPCLSSCLTVCHGLYIILGARVSRHDSDCTENIQLGIPVRLHRRQEERRPRCHSSRFLRNLHSGEGFPISSSRYTRMSCLFKSSSIHKGFNFIRAHSLSNYAQIPTSHAMTIIFQTIRRVRLSFWNASSWCDIKLEYRTMDSIFPYYTLIDMRQDLSFTFTHQIVCWILLPVVSGPAWLCLQSRFNRVVNILTIFWHCWVVVLKFLEL